MNRQSFAPEDASKYNGARRTLAAWFATEELGRRVLEWERAQFANATEDVFGFRAVQAGLPETDLLAQNRIPFRFTLALEPGAALAADPIQLLREAERVLMPEGQVVISGFNTLSLWRMRQWFADREAGAPWDAKFIGLLKLREWLRLLGFELNGGMFGCYAPPFRQGRWIEKFSFMEKAGARWWPIAGGIYVVRAVKRVQGMR